jgi:hypothetical protein
VPKLSTGTVTPLRSVTPRRTRDARRWSRSPALPPLRPLHAAPSASACRPRASGAAGGTAGSVTGGGHQPRASARSTCRRTSSRQGTPARAAGVSRGRPWARRAPRNEHASGDARHRAGVSTGSCQAPFSGSVTRAIGMPGAARVSTDSAPFSRGSPLGSVPWPMSGYLATRLREFLSHRQRRVRVPAGRRRWRVVGRHPLYLTQAGRRRTKISCMMCAATWVTDRRAVLFGDHSYRSDLYQ